MPQAPSRVRAGAVARSGEKNLGAWGPRVVNAVRPLLFERLTGEFAEPLDGLPTDLLYGRPELMASIEKELGHLFNTRAPVNVETLDRRVRTSIDYGIPDLSRYAASDSDARLDLAKQLTNAIAAYEPRLGEPKVTVLPDPQQINILVAFVEGTIMLDDIVERITFRVALPQRSGGYRGD